MSKGKLYEYAIILHPGEEVKGKIGKTTLLNKINHVVARDEKQAAILAAREIPENYLNRLDDVEVLVRPF
jgi:hypothetical protein